MAGVNSHGKLMLLDPPPASFNTHLAPIKESFYFHTPGPYKVGGGNALISENNVISQGGVIGLNNRGLRTVSWSSLFIINEYHSAEYAGRAPFVMTAPNGYSFMDFYHSRKFLNEMKDNNRIARLKISDRRIGDNDVDMYVILESFEWEEKEGEPDVRYYDISFKEYRRQTIRLVPAAGVPVPGKKPTAKAGKYFTTPSALTLDAIIKQAYGVVSTRLRTRLVSGNGGKTWITKLVKAKKATKNSSKSQYPYTLKKGVKLWVPPKTGSVKPPKK